jgi:ketosteroid isomerase-like protein
MKTSIRIACAAAFLILISGWEPGRTPASVIRAETVEDGMRQLSLSILAAYERRDTAALKSFYAKQPDALFFWERKMQYSWEQINSTMDDLVRFVAKIKLTTGEFRAGGSGDTGWFAATFHADRVTPDGKQFSSDGRWTVVAQRINGRWLIVHEHTSFPMAER